MSTKNESKKSLKNYVILGFIFLIVILVVWYINRWYQVYSDYQKETPVIRGVLTHEITLLDLDYYIMENPSSVVYMCTARDDRCRDFEKDFKRLIEKENLQNNIIYLNLSGEDKEEFVNDFNSKYNYKVKLKGNYPVIIEFTDGKITGLIEDSEKSHLTLSKVEQFMEIHHVMKEE